MVAQILKHMCRPERVVRAMGGGGVAGGATTEVASTAWLKVVLGCDRSWTDWNTW
jgi:hypothetical protein